MSEDYGANFISLTDDEGNEFELEHLDTIEYNGQVYMAFFPVEEYDEDAEEDEEETEAGMIILKVVKEGDEEVLVTVDDEEELDQVYSEFMESLFDEEE